MSARDDYRKVAAALRDDLHEGEEHLGWLLGEVERHLGLHAHASAPTPPATDDQPSDDEAGANADAADSPKSRRTGKAQ